MTYEEVRSLVRVQSVEYLSVTNDHRITLEQAIVAPQQISIVARSVENGHTKDEVLAVWLVGQEDLADGYKIILRDDGKQFGLASPGFAADDHLVLTGWYGTLLSAFLAM